MVNNLRQVRREFVIPVAVEPKQFKRINDPELVLEVATRREKNNLLAVRSGLPAVGSTLVNRYGLEFEVESHVHVPTVNSVRRWREGGQSDADLFPCIVPLNLSKRLTSFLAAVDRCTTKTLLVLDTMPLLRRDTGVPNGHWVDTIANGGANLLFIDAAQVHETHFAHEIGHLWVQYVDQAEDERVMEDVSNAGRLQQLSFVQSFVTDLRVNQVIAEKGFDVSVIVQDQAASIASLGRAFEAGYRPESPREGVFMALALAAPIAEERVSGTNHLAQFEDTLEKVTRLDPEVARLATRFADVVALHGRDTKDQIRASIDDCLKLAFDYSGDGIDLERDLVTPPIHEPDFDKYPQWLEGASPQMKCEVGRIIAREDIPDGSRWSVAQGPVNASLLSFELPDGTIRGPWTLEHSYGFASRFDHVQRVNELNRQNRERQMKNQANGMPNFPGQLRRFYMAGTARFLTRVREVEWLGGEHPYAYALNDPVTYTDPSGKRPTRDYAGRPILPPGASYLLNCCLAMKHPWPENWNWFYIQVRNRGPWDYKQWGRQFENAGNFHYGFVAFCAGIPLDVALRGGGYAQRKGGNSDRSFGTWWGGPPYGDDPKDQKNITEGYKNAERWKHELIRKCNLDSMKGCYENFRAWRDQEIDRIFKEGSELTAPSRWWDR